ncbi:transposase [Caballeronia udeis]|uniref:Transposase n=1 Tax=Caballeronia udeis TaxID=1232866 RepID=A0ABW8MXR2_9BURK
MKRFVEGEDRNQAVLLPEYLEDYVPDDNPVRVVDVFVDELDLRGLGFDGTAPAATGRPSYHPSVLLKIYIYGYLNRIQSSRRLERETQRNIELMWLTGRLSPDFKTIADFRRNNGKAIRNVCSEFIVRCRNLDLFSKSIVAIDGSKFKAVNNRDRNFTGGKVKARLQQIDESIARYLCALETADRTQSDVAKAKTSRIGDKISKLKQQMQDLKAMEQRLRESPDPIPGGRVASQQVGALGQALQPSGVDQISGLLSAHAAVAKHSRRERLPARRACHESLKCLAGHFVDNA